MPVENEILPETGERMVPERSAARIFWEHVERYQFARSYVVGKHVLDVACGEGYGSAALRKAGASSVVGIDIAQEVCDHARRKYGVDARAGDALALPLADASVDLVVSFETIEHVTDPSRFLAECARVLRPGGMLILSTPNRPVYSGESKHNPFHHHEFDRAEFLGLLHEKFSDAQLFSQTLKSAPWWNWRSLAAESSPWRRIKGFWRVTSWLCPTIRSDIPDRLRNDPVAVILAKPAPLAMILDPYRIQSTSRHEPYYWLAVATLI
jgi:ubiquinone/menaquinone biosynthesis C-methylase UbiE